jgi:hypothetical protein
VEFISFWYQSFGSKISLTIFYFHSISCSLLYQKNKNKNKKIPVRKFLPLKKISSFQSCFSKKIVPVPARKFLPFNLVSHLIQVLDLFNEFWLFFIFFFFFEIAAGLS